MDRFAQQINFIKELDKLKEIERRCLLINGKRRENTAEHSWHFAVMVPLLSEYAETELDMTKTIQIALVHDLVEIDAGDTYCYDEQGHLDKEERELAAAQRIFGLLPPDQEQQMWSLWREFEEGQTAEAKFARAVDRLNPFMLNFYSGGHTWLVNKVKVSQVLNRMGEIEINVPKLWPYVLSLIETAVMNGWIQEG